MSTFLEELAPPSATLSGGTFPSGDAVTDMSHRLLEAENFDPFFGAGQVMSDPLEESHPTPPTEVPMSDNGSPSELSMGLGDTPSPVWDMELPDIPDSMLQPMPMKAEVFKVDEPPAAKTDRGLTLQISGLPEKCRVETQQHVRVHLLNAQGRRVTSEKWRTLDLPTALLASAKAVPPPSLTGLKLEARVVCASDTTKEARSCLRCIKREQRLLERKRNKASKSGAASSASVVPVLPSEGGGDDLTEIEQKRILLFCGEPRIDFSTGQAIIPTRITCYCRHHDEPVGFCFQFTLVDKASATVIARATSSPIVITDDHKPLKTQKRARTEADSSARNVANPAAADPSHAGTVDRAIPNEGPTTGGIEVTLLGHQFADGNTALFGANEAPTQYWGDCTLIAVLPPSQKPETVDICVLSANRSVTTKGNASFTYREQSDVNLLSLALQVIGMRMSGRVESAHEIASQIIQRNAEDKSGSGTSNNTASTGDPMTSFADLETSMSNGTVPAQSIKPEDSALMALSKALASDSEHALDVNLQDNTGATMLHYAAWRGADRLVQWLARHGAIVNGVENRGLTALHFAAIRGHSSTINVLLGAGANKDARAVYPARTPLELAVVNQHEPAALILRGVPPPRVNTTPAPASAVPQSLLPSPAGETCRDQAGRHGYTRVRMDSQMSTTHKNVHVMEMGTMSEKEGVQDAFRFRHPAAWRNIHMVMGLSLLSVLIVGCLNVVPTGMNQNMATAPRNTPMRIASTPVASVGPIGSFIESTVTVGIADRSRPRPGSNQPRQNFADADPRDGGHPQEGPVGKPMPQGVQGVRGPSNHHADEHEKEVLRAPVKHVSQAVQEYQVEELEEDRMNAPASRDKAGNRVAKKSGGAPGIAVHAPPVDPWGNNPYELPAIAARTRKTGVGGRRSHSIQKQRRIAVTGKGGNLKRGSASASKFNAQSSYDTSIRSQLSTARPLWWCANVDAFAALLIVAVSYTKGPHRRLTYYIGALVITAIAQAIFFALTLRPH